MNEKGKFLLRDDSEKTLSTKEELKEYLRFRNENDVVQKCPINELRCFGLSNIPMFAQERIDDFVFQYKGYEMPIEKVSYDEVETKECVEETGVFLIMPCSDNKSYMLPTNLYSFSQILQRTDDFCGTMARTEPKQAKKILSPEEKVERLNRDFDLYSDDCLILFRDKKVRAVHSRVYNWLDNEKLIEVFEKSISEENPDLEFESGQVSHEYLVCNYKLNNELIEESLKVQLNEHGSDIRELTAGVKFITSDIGLSSVRAGVYLVIDGTEINLKGVSMEHKGGASIELFEEKLNKNFASILKESEERIEELGNIDIKDVAFVVSEIVENNSSIFPKKISEEVINELKIQFPTTIGGTAIDCYLALNEIISRHANSDKCGLSRYLNLSDSVAAMLMLPYDKIEAGNFYKN